uniref:DUF1559 domain-containing protein n=1 Tax=uncultured Armatimonadetes bacterium TaxID=157466 RepID=A0A6J4IYH5_9BACT|nr:hypothetical protein AVDCRST_MAG63-2646 [uncultured Armatimonadetes bacterium]
MGDHRFSRRGTPASRPRAGFTLIELLVVIAIIAILAGILFPVFAKAREKARQAQCLSNQRQIALSTLMYVQDYDETLPMSASLRLPNTLIQVYDLVLPYLKNRDVLTCPSYKPGVDWEARLRSMGLRSGGEFRYVAFLPNLALFGDNLCPLQSTYTPVSSLADAPVPAETLMFYDGYMKTRPMLSAADYPAYARHNEGVVVSYVDGHSKWHRYSGVPSGGKTPAGSRSPVYYSWKTDEPLRNSEAALDAAGMPGNPYNDLHGIPGTAMTDSEDTARCP